MKHKVEHELLWLKDDHCDRTDKWYDVLNSVTHDCLFDPSVVIINKCLTEEICPMLEWYDTFKTCNQHCHPSSCPTSPPSSMTTCGSLGPSHPSHPSQHSDEEDDDDTQNEEHKENK